MTSATLPIGISRLGQIAINVHDLDRATAFYRDVLALPLLFSAGGLAFFDCGGVRLMLSRPEKPEFDHPSSILYFTVPDIAGAHRQMLNHGVHFEDAAAGAPLSGQTNVVGLRARLWGVLRFHAPTRPFGPRPGWTTEVVRPRVTGSASHRRRSRSGIAPRLRARTSCGSAPRLQTP